MQSIILICLFLFLAGCEKEEEKKEPQRSSCEINHTAELELRNGSRYTTYEVEVNGSIVGSVGPTRSLYFTVAAGSYVLVFWVANSEQMACMPGYPNLAQCSSYRFTCSYDAGGTMEGDCELLSECLSLEDCGSLIVN